MTDPEGRPAPEPDETRAQDSGPRSADSVGPYRLIQPLGEGGMGIVWLAEQARPVRRKVALKIIKAGMDTSQVVARFDAERQALALMDHPAIARVFEAGATAEGRPYFAMEYVRGETITAYCALHKLSVRDRIGLFLQVCEGVQHAHQKGIIHRDLKPSNVLVMLQGDRPVPKIIDFGVAKATSQPLTDRTLHTELGTFIGTPEYMSPEQAEMSGLDVDTRTDVYSLGAILYELLTGAMPFESKALREKGLDEIRRLLRDVDPPRPSTRVTTAAADEPGRPPTRVEPSKLAAELKGDLDWITMKALEKDRIRRYGSASDLAADLQRHLDSEPVLASPPSTMYRVGKFVRRHRGGVAAAAALGVLLVAFGATMGVQARRLARERDRAARGEATARAVSDFLQDDLLGQASVFEQADAGATLDPDIKIRTALDRAASRIGDRFAGQPLVEASLQETIGEAYADLGVYATARPHFDRALDLRTRLLGPEHPETLRTLWSLAWVDANQAKDADARARYTKVYEIDKRRLGPGDPETLSALTQIGSLDSRAGRFVDAESELSQAVAGLTGAAPADSPRTLGAMHSLGAMYVLRGMPDKAEPLLTHVIEVRRRTVGPDHPEVVATLEMLAQVHGQRGQYDQAEAIRREILAIRTRTMGKEHPATLLAMGNLAITLEHEDQPAKTAEAMSILEKQVEAYHRVLGDTHMSTLLATANLAGLYADAHRYAEAEPLMRSDVTALRAKAGLAHPTTMMATAMLADMLIEQHRGAEAEPFARALLEGRMKAMPDHWRRFEAQTIVGAALAGQRKFAEAEPLLVPGYEGMLQRKASIVAYDQPDLSLAGQRVVDLYTAWGKPAQVAAWRTRIGPKPTP